MRFALLSTILASSVLATACSDPDDGGNEEEVITTVILSFAPMGGGTPVTALANDPDGDGGQAPTIDPVGLAAGTTYTLTVGFENRLETPAEIITDEVRDEGDQHQVFLTGTAVNGPASDRPTAPLTHTYGDTDAGGLPIGLTNTIVAAAGGPGDLTITLRHMPPVNDVAAKTAAAAMTVRTGSIDALPGATDVSVTFPVTIAVP
jgi:hypothetical protein